MKRWAGYEKGINLGGWLSQCVHTTAHYDTFITESDMKTISTWGVDHVRVPVDYNLLETENGAVREGGMDYIQRAIDWCEKYHLHMVLDLHKTAGYSFDTGENESGFFTEAALQERFYRLWERLARAFGKYADRVAFELLNEVTDPAFCDPWNAIADQCIRRIRAIAPTVYILVGGYHNNSIAALADLLPPQDARIVYNFHCYDPMLFTHQGAYWIEQMPSDFRLPFPDTLEHYMAAWDRLSLPYFADPVKGTGVDAVDETLFSALFSRAVALAEERGVSLYCGEYGVIDLADPESTVAWYKAIHAAFEKYGIGRAAWSYREMDFGLLHHPLFARLQPYL
jgi:aryl-phospho-beta-D-glucosidase BglC (GH1 family)